MAASAFDEAKDRLKQAIVRLVDEQQEVEPMEAPGARADVGPPTFERQRTSARRP